MKYSIPCSPQTPCRQHRDCDYCAALRQRYIAELCQSRYRNGVLTFATVTRLHGENIRIAQRLKPGYGGLWSVEAGTEMGGMHINLLFESQHELFAHDLAETCPIRDAEYWAKTVPAADIRNVAAYINKRTGMPYRMDYRGNLYGTWGTWRSARQVAQQQRVAPLLAAAGLEVEMNSLGIEPDSNVPSKYSTLSGTDQTTLTREQYREIALRNLPILRQMLKS